MAELNSISEFNEAFDLPELCILYLKKKIKSAWERKEKRGEKKRRRKEIRKRIRGNI